MASVEIEPSVHMRLYSMNKRSFATIFLVSLFCFGVLIIVGILGPTIKDESATNVSSLNKSNNLLTGPFILKSLPLTSFNQQMWLSMKYIIDQLDNGKFELQFTTRVQLRGYADQSIQENVFRGNPLNRTVTLTCVAGTCEDIPLVHLAHLANPYYIISINTYGLEAVQFKVNDVQLKFTTYNAQFTQLEIWFRFTFLILTFLATCSFAYSLRRFTIYNWSMEQKWMTLLLPLLILYNNPIFALTFLITSWVPGVVDIFFQTTFLAGLLMFWLCAYHGVRQIKRKFSSFYLPKMLLVFSLWFAIVFFSSWQRFKDLNDPTVGGDNLNFKIIIGILSGLYLLSLIYLIIRAFAELRSMPYFDLRLKFMTALMIVFFIICFVIVLLRDPSSSIFGIGFFQALSPYPISTIEFVILYGMLNVHLISMAFVYSPSSTAFYESHFKDNPALSMLNESDDDVVYGEEISLTSNRPIRQRYDSDDEAFN